MIHDSAAKGFAIGANIFAAGQLGLVWSVRDKRVAWVRAISGIMAPYEANTPRCHTDEWKRVFPSPLFSGPDFIAYAHRYTGQAEAVIINRRLSASFTAALPADERTKVAQEVQQLINGTQQLTANSTVSFPYRTEAFAFTKSSVT